MKTSLLPIFMTILVLQCNAYGAQDKEIKNDTVSISVCNNGRTVEAGMKPFMISLANNTLPSGVIGTLFGYGFSKFERRFLQNSHIVTKFLAAILFSLTRIRTVKAIGQVMTEHKVDHNDYLMQLIASITDWSIYIALK